MEISIFVKIRELFKKWEKTSTGEDLLCSGWGYLTAWRTLCLGRITLSQLGAFKVSQWYKAKFIVREVLGILLVNAPVLRTYSMPRSRRIFIFSWFIDNGAEDERDNYLGLLTPDLTDAVSRINICIPNKIGPFDHNRDGYFVFERTILWNLIWFSNALVQTIFYFFKTENWLANWSIERRNSAYMTRQLASWMRASEAIVETVIFPYEQHPWQCDFIRYFKREYPKTKIVGYIHSSLNNVPTQFVKHRFTPDFMFVHGSAYKRVLADILGWSDRNIQLIDSLRFSKPLKVERSTIFLPYSFTEEETILDSIKSLVDLGIGLRGADIRLHPIKCNDSKHLRLKREIEEVLECSLEQVKIAIVTVGVSTVTLEALEADYDVFSIFEDPEKDAIPTEIWLEIVSHRVHSHCFQYKILNKEALIKLKDAEDTRRTIISLSSGKNLG